jgi:hypothetical protein
VEDEEAAAEADEVAKLVAASTQRVKSAAETAAEEAMEEMDPPSDCAGGEGGRGDSPELVGALAMVVFLESPNVRGNNRGCRIPGVTPPGFVYVLRA